MIRSRTDYLSITTIRSLVCKLNWYDGKDRLKKVLKDNDFTVERLIKWDTDEIARIHFVSKKSTASFTGAAKDITTLIRVPMMW